jgi:hypothetical protein
MISDVSSVIAKYLNIWLYQAICSRMIDHLCNFVYKPHFSISCLTLFVILDDPFGNS